MSLVKCRECGKEIFCMVTEYPLNSKTYLKMGRGYL